MSFSQSLDPGALGWISLVIWLLFVFIALFRVPWRILKRETGLQHLFLGSILVVAFLWQLRADINLSVSIHLLMATSLTLMFYWPMALLATSLALLGVTLMGKTPWEMLGINGLVVCLLPVTISHWVWRLVEWKFPPNFFIFVLLAGAGGAVAAALGSGLAVIAITAIYTSGHEFARLSGEYFLFLPLTLPPEAVVNGMILTGLTAFMPDWVRAFDPKRYLDEN
ncbi:energy-coupling factor ABC transporter permease [Marinospirillum perlucidum]|uniref:energy-coupling factor ABC transporter permease n=1 Tax=Marinospirillum perlucidum TaxID=1982602 RepID=UPI000DF2C903|nr:energy-coupling factor ABC transporter permease [Marinospirillum perlucidum]